MKIGLISTFPPQECGVGTKAQEQFEELNSREGVEAIRISSSSEAEEHLDMDSYLLSDRIEEIFDERNLDLIHIHHTMGLYGLKGLDLSRIREDIPVVCSFHEPNSDIPYSIYSIRSRFDAFVQTRLLDRFDRVIVHTKENVSEFPEYSEKMSYVPLGTKMRDVNISDSLDKILFFGFVHENKNIEPLIRSAEFHDKDIIIAGNADGEDAEEYTKEMKDIAEEFEYVEMDVRWIPSDEKDGFFDGCDCVALPYKIERAGSGVLEDALEYCKPMIASKRPIFQETVGDESLGVVVDPTPKSIADAVEDLDENYSEYMENLQTYRENHSWVSVVSQHLEIYDSLLDA